MKSKRIILWVMLIFIIGMGVYNFKKFDPYRHKVLKKDTVNNKTIINNDLTKETNNKKNIKVKKQGEEIPVLMYHCVTTEKGEPIKVNVKDFDKQMKYLKTNGYTTLTLDDLYGYFLNKNNIPEKSVVITFDDGYKDNYTNAYPILKKYGFNATIFIITEMINKGSDYITIDNAKELDRNGVKIENHTLNHKHLNTLSYTEQLKEIKESKDFIEKNLNKKVNYIAYPYGEYNDDTINIVKSLGYKMGFTTGGRWSSINNGIYTLDRVYIGGDFNLNVFIDRVTNNKYKFIQ